MITFVIVSHWTSDMHQAYNDLVLASQHVNEAKLATQRTPMLGGLIEEGLALDFRKMQSARNYAAVRVTEACDAAGHSGEANQMIEDAEKLGRMWASERTLA